MLSIATDYVSIIDEDYASIRVYNTTYTYKVLWLGIKIYSYTPTQIETICYILKECLYKSEVPLIIYFQHLTEQNADVPDFEIMKQISINLLGMQHQIKKKVSLTIFHPKVLDHLTKTGFNLLSTMYTVKNLYISDSKSDIDQYVNAYLINTFKDYKN